MLLSAYETTTINLMENWKNVMPRKRHVSRNFTKHFVCHTMILSCLARGMWVETMLLFHHIQQAASCLARGMWVETEVTIYHTNKYLVMPRKRHVSRNLKGGYWRRWKNVMPRKRHVSRNSGGDDDLAIKMSCLTRGMWVETRDVVMLFRQRVVMPRKRHVSRNIVGTEEWKEKQVMPRKRHVSRNCDRGEVKRVYLVMPRKRHVSRNWGNCGNGMALVRHASQEACE